jgi:hypothetical protein
VDKQIHMCLQEPAGPELDDALGHDDPLPR